MVCCLLPLLWSLSAFGQNWDLGRRFGESFYAASNKKLRLSFESRARLESRKDVSFGNQRDYSAALIRTRVGMTWQALPWLKLSGMVQDSRAPGYGSNPPAVMRDPADLHEAYIELGKPASVTVSAGRTMAVYGEGRLIGSQNWLNVPRSFDLANLVLRRRKARFEFLTLSPVKARPGGYNRPQLNDHLWGTYNSFPDLLRGSLLEFYVLRRSWTQAGIQGINTFGLRMAGPLGPNWRYGLEGALQNGKSGGAPHRGGAWFSNIVRRWKPFGKTLEVSAEYKYASGTEDPSDRTRSGTFDQLYPTNHDKFGHEDLFGWRNIHNARSLTTLALTRTFSLNFMYDSFWLASRRDAVYALNGQPILSDPTGRSGRHLGQEFDGYVTFRYERLLFGSGYARFRPGEYIRNTRPNAHPTFLYVFYVYSF